METKKPKVRFNIFDVAIIALVLAALAAALLLRDRAAGTEAARSTEPIRYTVEITMAPPAMADAMHVGDDVYRSTDNVYLGKLVDIRSVIHRENAYSPNQSKYIQFESQESRDIYLTIEGQGYSTPKDIVVESAVPKVCGDMYVKGKGYAKMGYVCAIDPMNAPIVENTDSGTGSVEATYVLRFADMREMLLPAVHEGDHLYESITGSLLGVVQDVWTEPYGETHLNGVGVAEYAEKPGVYNLFVRVKGRAVEQADGYYLDGGTELKVGATIVAQSQYISRSAMFYALESVGAAQ